MKSSRVWLVVLLFLIPIAGRWFWLYPGFRESPGAIAIPEYKTMGLSLPELSTPMPLATSVSSASPIVLFDQTHGNLFTLSEIEPLTRALTAQGARLESLSTGDTFTTRLKSATALVIIAPTTFFNAAEKEAIQRFVKSGGKMVVLTDPTRNTSLSETSALARTSVDVSNLLLESYRIAFANDYLYDLKNNEGNFRNVKVSLFSKDNVTKNISGLVFYSAHSIKSDQQSLVEADDSTYSSITDQGGGLVLAARNKEHNVIAIGDVTFLTAPYYQVGDNQVLVINLATFLAGNERLRELADFPALFNHPIDIVLPKDLRLDKDSITSLSALQKTLEVDSLSLVNSIPLTEGTDIVYIGILPPSDQLKLQIEEFHLEFSNNEKSTSETPASSISAEKKQNITPTSEGPSPSSIEVTPTVEPSGRTVTVPGLGILPLQGTGIILFHSSAARNKMILLAETQDGLKELIDLISTGDLSTCLVHSNAAVCGLSALKTPSPLPQG